MKNKPLLSDEDIRMIDAAAAAAPPMSDELIAEVRNILHPWEWSRRAPSSVDTPTPLEPSC